MAKQALAPRESSEPEPAQHAEVEREEDGSRSGEERPTRRAKRWPRWSRWMFGVAVFLALLVATAYFSDPYLRTFLEKQINGRLQGYSASIGHAHFNPFRLALILDRVVIRQDANPQPPVADLSKLTASVEWQQILRFRLVADAKFERPRVHVNLPQLRQESKDAVNVADRGWQDALEAIFPLKFNLIEVREGGLVYIDVDPKRPLQVSRWNFTASNIRNIESPDRTYPSPIHTDGVIFGVGHGVLNGHADFLAKPYPGAKAVYRVENVPLDRLRPIVQRANLTLSGGFLSSHGDLELGPKHRQVHVVDATARQLHLEYTHSPATAAAEERRGKKVAAVAKDPTPEVPVRIDRFAIQDGRLGYIGWAKEKRFHVFVDDADLTVTGLSTGFREGPAKASFTGRFMGSGATNGSATFRNPSKGPDFDMAIQVQGANLTSINDLLWAYGRFDVAKGTFSVFSEIEVKNGRIEGYVKPLFSDIDVYSSKQDKDKPALKKVYEKIVGGLSHLLENQKRDEVATVANLSGPLDSPNASNWQIFVNLVSNAFVKAILPGFEKEYEAAMKRKKK
jgi:hypothetical protein